MNQESASDVLRAKGKTFYWASRLLSRKHADRAANLYRVCRHLDDIVDEATSKSEARIELKAFKEITLSGTFFIEAKIDARAFNALTEGIESDLGEVVFQNDVELLHYCYRVAGTVGIMMCNVLDVNHPDAMKPAVDLGIAMQLTNICRDVATDAQLGRRYLPATLVGCPGLEDLIAPPMDKRCELASALKAMLELAERYYASGERGIVYLPVGARFGILLAARLYREIGIKLARREYDYWTHRVHLNRLEKIFITVRTLVQFTSSSLYWRRS